MKKAHIKFGLIAVLMLSIVVVSCGSDNDPAPIVPRTAAGSDLTFVVATGLDHYYGCNYAPYMADVEVWLLNSVWD